MESGCIGRNLVEHGTNEWKILLVGSKKLFLTCLKIILQPDLSVVEMKIFILDNTLSNLASEGISNWNINVIGGNSKSFNQECLNQ